MKRLLLLLTFLTIIACVPRGKTQTKDYQKIYKPWELTAFSALIFEGNLMVNSSDLKGKKEQEIVLNLEVTKVLKGDRNLVGKSVKVNYFNSDYNYSDFPSSQKLNRYNHKKVLCYLRSKEHLVQSSNSIERYSELREEQILEALKKERKILAYDFSKDYHDASLQKEANEFIDKLLTSQNSMEIYKAYNALDKNLIPYLILEMEDYRKLSNKHISVTGSWELSHYRVEKVIDALSLILADLAKVSFDSLISPLPTDLERKQVAEAWRVWLYRKLFPLGIKN